MAKRSKTSRTTRAAPVSAPPAGTPGTAPRFAATRARRPAEVAGRRSPDVRAADRARGPAAWLGAFSAQDGAAALALAVLVAVSYFPALQGGFVWDDVIFAEEPVIHSPGALRSIWFAPADIKNEGHYWPLVYSSFWLEHRLWGLQPAGYHAVNLFLHLLNCLLLWRLLLRLQVPGALLIAAVFAVHPLHVESVAWIIERKDVLSALFYLGAVLAWLRFVEVERAGHYLLVGLLFAAGLLSKSVVVTLPLALLLVQWWRGGRVTGVDLLRVAPLMVLGVAITAADLAFYRGREVLELGYTLAERMLIAGRALWFYAGKLVWPLELAVIYPLWEIDARSVAGWGYVVAAAGLALALWLLRERIGRGPLAGALYFALTLGPVLGFVDYGYMQFSFVADRFQYLAGIGVLAVLLGGAAHWLGKLVTAAEDGTPTERLATTGSPSPAGSSSAAGLRSPARSSSTARPSAASGSPSASGSRYGQWVRYAAWGLAAAMVVLLGALTWRQAGIYRDEITLFSHVVAHNPAARDAHLNLGSALFEAERMEEGLAASRIAAQQRPESAGALANVGRALVHFERFTEAEEHLRRALELDPRSTTAHQNLAEALRKQGRHREAVESYRAVLELDAGFALAYAGMGTALYEARRYPEALAALEQALVLQPELAERATLASVHGPRRPRAGPLRGLRGALPARRRARSRQRGAASRPGRRPPPAAARPGSGGAAGPRPRAAPARSRGAARRRRGAPKPGPRRGGDRRLPRGAGARPGVRPVARRAGDRAISGAALPRGPGLDAAGTGAGSRAAGGGLAAPVHGPRLGRAGRHRRRGRTVRAGVTDRAAQPGSARSPGHGALRAAALRGRAGAVPDAVGDQSRQRADPLQRRRRAVPSRPPAGGAAEHRARPGPGPGPGDRPHRPRRGAQAPEPVGTVGVCSLPSSAARTPAKSGSR